MFNSTDTDNHILAMEIMANSNYMESLLYIEMLFKRYAYPMSNCHTKNHVNFKSLLAFLGKSFNYYDTTLDDIVRSLRDKNVVTVDKINILLDHFNEEIVNSGSTAFFEVKSITLTNDLATLLNTNYVYTSKIDYVPVVPVVEDEATDEEAAAIASLSEINDVEEELLELEESEFFSESELNKQEDEEIKQEVISEQELAHDLYGVDNEDIEGSFSAEPESNNNQITDNGSDSFEWF